MSQELDRQRTIVKVDRLACATRAKRLALTTDAFADELTKPCDGLGVCII